MTRVGSTLTADAAAVGLAERWARGVTTPFVPAEVLARLNREFGAMVEGDQRMLRFPAGFLWMLAGSLPREDPWRSLSACLAVEPGRCSDDGCSATSCPDLRVLVRKVGDVKPPRVTGAVAPDGVPFAEACARDFLVREWPSPITSLPLSPLAAAALGFAGGGIECLIEALRGILRLVSADDLEPSGAGLGDGDRTPGALLLSAVVVPAAQWLLWRRSVYLGCADLVDDDDGRRSLPLGVAVGRAVDTIGRGGAPFSGDDLERFKIPDGDYRLIATGTR